MVVSTMETYVFAELNYLEKESILESVENVQIHEDTNWLVAEEAQTPSKVLSIICVAELETAWAYNVLLLY